MLSTECKIITQENLITHFQPENKDQKDYEKCLEPVIQK